MVTSNHVHLSAKDAGRQVIPQSMQLIAGRTAQEYNQRKGRQGAFWEDRYDATAIEADEHPHRCLACIDLNMVRAGVVKDPAEWAHSGYREIQEPPERYAIIDLRGLSALCGFAEVADFPEAHRKWVGEALAGEMAMRDDRWSGAIAVGGLTFVAQVKSEFGFKARYREVVEAGGTYTLREQSEAYAGDFGSESDLLMPDNTVFWKENAESTKA